MLMCHILWKSIDEIRTKYFFMEFFECRLMQEGFSPKAVPMALREIIPGSKSVMNVDLFRLL
jgi:hypothetical protein